MNKIRALVLTGFGINCEVEMAAAYKLAGAEADVRHLNEVFHQRVNMHEYDIMNFPGGFSFGDDLGSAKVLANKFKYKKMDSGLHFIDEIQKFLDKKKYIIGVCNGFQALVKMGLLPNTKGNFEQEATLTHNDSGKFEDRWVTVKVNEKSDSPFLRGMDLIDLPVRHGEGKLLIKDEETKQAIVENNMNCLTYVDEAGNPTAAYPQNPNGSELNCAGLVDSSRRVFGLMPHPEAFLSLYNHPNWGAMKRRNSAISEEGQGLQLFKNIVEYLKKQ